MAYKTVESQGDGHRLASHQFMHISKYILATLMLFAFSIARAQDECGAALKTLSSGARSMPVPIERFSNPIAEIFKILKDSKSVEESLDVLVKSDGRGSLFQLEGLLRIYSEIYPEGLKLWHEKIKILEDAFGKYTEKVEYFEGAQKLNGVPKEALTKLEEDVRSTRQTLRKALVYAEWLTEEGKPGPTWNDFAKDIKAQDWSDKEEDGDQFVQVMIDEMKDVRDALDKGEYSPYQLQTGVHELRRHLRWFLIYFQAGNGLFKLVMPRIGMDLKDYVHLVNEPIAKSRFSKLPENPRIESPYTMPFHYFLALSMKVQEIGETKATAELLEALKEAYVQSGLAKTKSAAEKMVETIFKANQKPVTFSSRAKSLMDEMVDSEMLKIIRKWLKIQLRGGDPLAD